jgi:hypothetical protein
MLRLVVAISLGAVLPRQTPQPPARMREQARVDSLRRVMQARSDSLIRARRLEAARGGPPQVSPLFGEPPFYGYNWVFYADLAVGALTGAVATWLRRRRADAASMLWLLIGTVTGVLGAVAVFLPLYLMNAFFSVGFSAMAPGLMFGLTLLVIVPTGLVASLSRRRG